MFLRTPKAVIRFRQSEIATHPCIAQGQKEDGKRYRRRLFPNRQANDRCVMLGAEAPGVLISHPPTERSSSSIDCLRINPTTRTFSPWTKQPGFRS